MASVHQLLVNRGARKIAAVFCAVIVTFQPAFASTASATPAVAHSADHTAALVHKRYHVKWDNPKFVQLIGNERGRFIFEGKTMPGAKIEIERGAVSIDARRGISNLTITEMAPSQRQTIFGPNAIMMGPIIKEFMVGPSGRFKIFLTLPLAYADIPFKVTLSHSRVENYVIAMKFDKKLISAAIEAKTKKQGMWRFGLEARSVAYSQTNMSNLNETMLAAQISYERQFTKRWSFRTQSFIDIARDTPFTTTQSDVSARFWGLNSDFIYFVPLRSPKWSLGVAGGFYYMTMFPSGQSFGFGNMWGPELFPILRYSRSSKNIFDFYFRYAPAGSQITTNFMSHESAVGGTWQKLYNKDRSISLNVEFLQDEFINGDVSTKSNAINFGVSYGVP